MGRFFGVMGILLVAMLGRVAVGDGGKVEGVVTTWAAPAGARGSEDYKVRANGREVFVYETGVHMEPESRGEKVGYACFDMTGAVEVRVVCAKAVGRAEVRPASLGIKARVEGKEIVFRLEKPAKVEVDVDGKTSGGLILFAGAPEVGVPLATDKDVVYFGPGVHEVKTNEYNVLELRSGQTLYVAGGAILRARILVEKADHVRICGRGIIDGSTLPSRYPDYLRKLVGEKAYKYRPVFVDFRDSHDVVVEGVQLIDSPGWTVRFVECRDLAARDLRLIGYVPNSDGIDVVNSQRVRITDCFIRTSDDAIVLKGYESRKVPHRGNVEDVVVEGCTLWADRASALEIGHETEADEIRNVTFRDIDILEQIYADIGYHAMDIHAGDEAFVHDILYDDIRVEHCQRLIGMKIEKGIFNRSKGWGRIERVRFRNIQSLEKGDVSLFGHSEEHAISDVTFENVTVRGKGAELEVRANGFVRGLHFVNGGDTRTVERVVPGDLKFVAAGLGGAATWGVEKAVVAGNAKSVVGVLPAGREVMNGIPFELAGKGKSVAVLPVEGEIGVGRKCRCLFFLQGWTGTPVQYGALEANGTVLWAYEVRYADGGVLKVPVRLNADVCPWTEWAAGGWVVALNGHKFYVQMVVNPHPEKVVRGVGVVGKPSVGMGILLGVTAGE